MMKIFVRVALCALILALISGCCNCRKYQKQTRRPLVQTEWQLIQLGGQSMTPQEGKFTLQFSADGRVSGVAVCNRVMGSYTSSESGELKIGQLAGTMMACPGMEQERPFTEAVSKTTHYEMDGPMLMLLADGELLAIFQAKI